MKKIVVLLFIAACFFSCTKTTYKTAAVTYLKAKLPNPASLDTIKFMKPDSIYTSFYDSKEYRSLRRYRNEMAEQNNTSEVAKTDSAIQKKVKTDGKKIVGWDIRLVYKAKNKKGILQTDTCRFTFDTNLYDVKDLNGVNIQ